MFKFKCSALAKEKLREVHESNESREKKETWKKINSRDDLTKAEKELLMLFHYVDSFKAIDLKCDHKKQYEALKEKGYAHELDSTHTFYHTEPLTRAEAEKMATEFGWEKKCEE